MNSGSPGRHSCVLVIHSPHRVQSPRGGTALRSGWTPPLSYRSACRFKRKPLCYAVRVGRKTGIFEDFREAQGYTAHFKGAEWKGFLSIAKAQEYLEESLVSPAQRLTAAISRERSSLVIYTDGSADRSPESAGWGWLALDPTVANTPPQQATPVAKQWGPVNLDTHAPDFLGAQRPTNNTGELSAIGQALRWVSTWTGLSKVMETQIRTDSQWACGVLSGGKVRANKLIVRQTKDILQRLRAVTTVHLIWIKGHQTDGSNVAYWNAQADWLAGQGMRGHRSDGVVERSVVSGPASTACAGASAEGRGEVVEDGEGLHPNGVPRSGIGWLEGCP